MRSYYPEESLDGLAIVASTATVPPARDSAAAAPFERDLLLRRCMGRTDLLDRLLASFEQRFPQDIATLTAHCAALLQQPSTDAADCAVRLAHQMKGAAANMSAASLQACLHDIEELGRAAAWPEISPRLIDLQEEWQRFVQFRRTQPAQTTASNIGRLPPIAAGQARNRE